MLDSLAQLLLSGKFSDVPPHAAMLYFTLRADIANGYTATARLEKKNLRLVSGLDLQAIARIVGVPEATAARLINDLAKRRLISRETLEPHNTLYILGHITENGAQWLADESSEMRASKLADLSPSEIIQRKLEEDRNRVEAKRSLLPRDLQKKIADNLFKTKEEKKVPNKLQKLLAHFKERYRSKYKAEPELVREGSRANPMAVTNTYLSRCIKMSGSFDKALVMIDFFFDHWEKLKAGYGWSGDILINHIGSSKVWQLVSMAMEDGIPDSKKNAGSRYDSDAMEEASDKGWE